MVLSKGPYCIAGETDSERGGDSPRSHSKFSDSNGAGVQVFSIVLAVWLIFPEARSRLGSLPLGHRLLTMCQI